MSGHSKIKFLFFALAALAFAALALMPAVNAASFKWASENAGDVKSCACEAQRLSAEIRNDASETQRYAFEASFGASDDKFSFFIPQSIEVPAKTSKTITLIAAPACNAPLADYDFTLTAFGSKGEELSLDGSINVAECRSLKVNAPAEVPACSGETAVFEIRVVNDGETRAEGSIITDLTPNVFTLSDSGFDLASGREKTVTLRVNVPALTPPGAIPFKINAVAKGVYAETLAQVTVLDCSGLRILAPGVIEADPATSSTHRFALSNDAAGADSFALTLANCPAWVVLETKTLSLDASATGGATLTVTPPNEAAGKQFDCAIRAKSAKRGNVVEAATKIRVALPSAALLSMPLGGEYCEAAAPINLTVALKNAGDYQGTFEIAASGAPGKLDADLASLAPGEIKRFGFAFDASHAGSYALTVTVQGAFGKASKTAALRVVKCNEFQVTLSPASETLCANETKNFTLTITNTGKRTDSYAITAQAPGFAASVSDYAASVAPSASRSLSISLTAPGDSAPSGARSLIVSVKSNAAQATKNAGAALELRGGASCASINTLGPTGAFASLYTGVAGFLLALIIGLFIVFVLAGSKKTGENAEEGGTESKEKGETEKESGEKKEESKGKNKEKPKPNPERSKAKKK